MSCTLRILLVEDSDDDAALIIRELRRGGKDPQVERIATRDAMAAALVRQPWDVVLADYTLPQFSALAALAEVQARGLDLPFLVVSGTIGEETAVAAMKAGAHDYLMKGKLQRLVPAIEREVRDAAVRRERAQAEAQLRHLAYYDSLTGLPNRALLQESLQQAIEVAQRDRTSLALLLVDVHRFREINTTLGYAHGDLLLQQVGQRVQEALPASALVARLDADKFAVLLPADATSASRIAHCLLETFQAPFVLDELPFEIIANIGIALFPEHGTEAAVLMRHADVAVDMVKRTGSGYAVYTAEHDHYAPQRLTLMGELRLALNHQQLCLHYQPKVHLATGRITGVEALMRWPHPHHGMIPPGQFIPLAEQTGLIKPLTLWALATALHQCQAWQQEGLALPVIVNLSVRNLHDDRLPDEIARLLDVIGVAPSYLGLEITESFLMADPVRALAVLTHLRDMGVRLSIDDFGTGYSSLSYLKQLPVHELKIDRAFVAGLMRARNDAVIVRAIVDLGHHMGLKVVAEGVEDQQTWHGLVALGCDEAQGYFMSRPLPAADLTRWVEASPYAVDSAPLTCVQAEAGQ